MGFHRHPQPAAVTRAVLHDLIEQRLADFMPPADPFGIDHDCLNPAGHDFIASCGVVVCVHCSKVVWS